MKVFALLALIGLSCLAQRVFVYSPLTRIGPDGNIVRLDRGFSEPRTILSPGVPRNGVTPLRIVVELDKPEPFWLDIGQNPENAVKARLYRENFIETPKGFLPDTLIEVSIPYRGFETDFRLPGQKAVTFWLEMGVAKDAPVDRIKVEPELYTESMKDWVVYPMEVRIEDPVLPDAASVVSRNAPDAAVTAPADTAIFPVICADHVSAQTKLNESSGQLTTRELLRRYAQQDITLLKQRSDLDALFRKVAGTDRKTWCTAPRTPSTGPEWYLRLRDAIYRQASAAQ